MSRLLLCLSILLAAAPLRAEDWFEVEMLVFRHTTPTAGASETWPADPGRPDLGLASEPQEPQPGVLLPLTRLEPNPGRLQGSFDALRRSSRYQPLGYWTWIQPGFERGSEMPVRISLGEDPVPGAGADAATVDAAGFPVLGSAADAPPPVPPLRRPLDGLVALGLQRYLYVSLDLVFAPEGLVPRLQPDASSATDATMAVGMATAGELTPPVEFQGFRLRETRRLRSREMHYFDHPLFGVILLVTPRPMPDIPPPR